jgi:hypothetical protein
MDGSSGPETKVHRGTATYVRLHCFARRGAFKSATSQYTPIAPSFFPERERSLFSDGAPDGWDSARFQAVPAKRRCLVPPTSG